MKIRLLAVLVLIAASGSSGPAQTVYIPSATNGIDSSANSNVGIGTGSSPAEKLEVAGRIRTSAEIYSTGAGATRVGFLDATGAANPDTYFGLHYDPTNNIGVIQALTGGVAWRGLSLVPNGGNVGIGTSTPSVGLQVQRGASGFPVTSGTTQTHGVFRFGASDSTLVLDGGGNSSNGIWLQSTSRDDLALEFPLLLNPNGGNVGIGTTSPSHKLAVNGTIRAKEIIVDTGWADFVFDPDYRLAPLSDVEAHIREKRRLPGLPSEATVAKEGVSLGEMQKLLLQKIEELTLHVIRLEKEVVQLQSKRKL